MVEYYFIDSDDSDDIVDEDYFINEEEKRVFYVNSSFRGFSYKTFEEAIEWIAKDIQTSGYYPNIFVGYERGRVEQIGIKLEGW